MKIYSIFHISLLKQFIELDIFDYIQLSFLFIIIKNQIEYEIEDILDSKILCKYLFYFIKWKDYLISNNSWEFIYHLLNSKELIQDFHFQYSNKSSISLFSIFINSRLKRKKDHSKKINFVDINFIFYSSNSLISIFFDLIIISICV